MTDLALMKDIINPIDELIKLHLREGKNTYSDDQIMDSELLLSNSVLILDDGTQHNFSINMEALPFRQGLVRYIEKESQLQLPSDLREAFQYALSFEKKWHNNTGAPAAYQLKQFWLSMRCHILSIRDNACSAFLLFKEINNVEKENTFLKKYNEAYFLYLSSSGYTVKTLFESLATGYLQKNYRIPAAGFITTLANREPVSALFIYEYGLANDITDIPRLASAILTAISYSMFDTALKEAKALSHRHPLDALETLAYISITTSEQCSDVFNLATAIAVNNKEEANAQSQALCNLIEHTCTDENIKQECFQVMAKLLRSDDHSVADAVFFNLNHHVSGFESDRYALMNVYLNNTKRFSVLDHFFDSFTDPSYLFHLLAKNYEMIGFRSPLDRFRNSLAKFWKNHREATENELINLFAYGTGHGMLALKIMCSKAGSPMKIDVTKIEGEALQINTIVSFCNFPHSIDKLVPILLPLRFSQYPGTVEALQEGLSELIMQAYHEPLFKVIKKQLTDTGPDRAFLIPLEKSLDDYQKLKETKSSIKDLDPFENEKSLVDLYYRLEHEAQAKSMKKWENQDNSFLSATKKMVIVRGNAWKSEYREEVVPMIKYETSSLIDARAYKDTLAYERALEML